MKAFVFFLLGLIAVAQAAEPPLAREILEKGEIPTVNCNDYVDKFIKLLNPQLINFGFDPYFIDHFKSDFWFEFLFINYTGFIQLDNGYIQDLSTLHRTGEATLGYDNKFLYVAFTVGVDDALISGDYRGEVAGFGPSGFLTGSMKDLQINVSLIIDLNQVVFNLQQLKAEVKGDINIKMTGLGIINGIAEALINAVADIFKTSLVNAVVDQITAIINNFLSNLPPFLPPPVTTEAPEQTTTGEFKIDPRILVANLLANKIPIPARRENPIIKPKFMKV